VTINGETMLPYWFEQNGLGKELLAVVALVKKNASNCVELSYTLSDIAGALHFIILNVRAAVPTTCAWQENAWPIMAWNLL